MSETASFSIAIVTGLVLLGYSADRFVAGASDLARSLGISTMVIGLTVVAFGTSAPEMLVSAMAAWQGNSGLAIGNAVGSNIANIGLVLGVSALVAPLAVRSQTLRREFPLMLVVMLASLALLWDGDLSRLDGLLLLAGILLLVLWTVHLARSSRPDDPLASEFAEEIPATAIPSVRAWWLLLSGLVMLLIASRLLVWGAVGIAEGFGVSDLVIGLSIVAVGTSLPELATSVAAARKGEHGIAVGNVVGSNLFNLLAVLGIAGVIGPGGFEAAVLTRDFPLMIALTVVLYILAGGFNHTGPRRVNRYEGAVLLAVFVAYQIWLYGSVA